MKNYRIFVIIFFSLFIFSCNKSIYNETKKIKPIIHNKYKNTGFTLIYNDDLENIKKLEARSLHIYHKSLKRRSMVKITNPQNGNSLIAEVKSSKIKFSNFYNSVISQRIAEELELNFEEPYIEIVLISKDSTFISKKTKTFDEERSVAEKAPIDGIQIKDLNVKKKIIKKVKNKNSSYSIKVADFYYKDTANIMLKRIKDQTSINDLKIIRLSETNYRVLIGPFNDIKRLMESYEKMNSFNFENLEILKNG